MFTGTSFVVDIPRIGNMELMLSLYNHPNLAFGKLNGKTCNICKTCNIIGKPIFKKDDLNVCNLVRLVNEQQS